MPDYTIPALHESSLIPAGVYDLDTLEAELRILNLPVTRPNIRRIRRAIDLHQNGAVRPFQATADADAFFVHSQNSDKCYSVLPYSGCNCPDAKRMNGDETYSASHQRINQTADRCKHEMATLLYKEQQANQANVDQHEAGTASMDDSLVHYAPAVGSLQGADGTLQLSHERLRNDKG